MSRRLLLLQRLLCSWAVVHVVWLPGRLLWLQRTLVGPSAPPSFVVVSPLVVAVLWLQLAFFLLSTLGLAWLLGVLRGGF